MAATPPSGFLRLQRSHQQSQTYPGGRFLKTGPVTNGTVVLDFNRAYNPPCSVTAYATCPLAPKENRLCVAIAAGQEYDRKHATTRLCGTSREHSLLRPVATGILP